MSMDELFGSDEPDTPMGPVGHAWKREAERLRAEVERLSPERAGPNEQRVRDGIDPREEYTEGEHLLLRAQIAEAQVLDLRADVERLRAVLGGAPTYPSLADAERGIRQQERERCAAILRASAETRPAGEAYALLQLCTTMEGTDA